MVPLVYREPSARGPGLASGGVLFAAGHSDFLLFPENSGAGAVGRLAHVLDGRWARLAHREKLDLDGCRVGYEIEGAWPAG